MKLLTPRSLISVSFSICLPGLVSGNCNPQSCAGALAGSLAPSVAGAAAGESATIAGCAAASVLTAILPFLAPVDLICWAVAAIEPIVTGGGPIALAGLAGGCDSCTAAKPCDRNDAVARKHGCGTDDPGAVTLGPDKCVQLRTSILPKDRKDTDRDQPQGTGPHGALRPVYTFHCANHGLVVDTSGSTCYWDCSWCTDQCPPPQKKLARTLQA